MEQHGDMIGGVLVSDLTERIGADRIDEYFGTWAIEERAFAGIVDNANRVNLQLHLDEADEAQAAAEIQGRADRGGDTFITQGDIAIVTLSGTLMKQVSSMANGTSTIEARRQIRAAMRAHQAGTIGGLMLMVDSPGGTVAGMPPLADDIAAAAAQMPVHAHIADIGASGAMWAASQVSFISAQQNALVGSIGTYSVLVDQSGRAEQLGLVVHVVRAGEFKGAGAPGTEITAEILAEEQRIVDELNEQFLAAVARGRQLSLSAVRALADGRVHVGQAAVDLQLIDAVESFDAAMGRLRSAVNSDNERSRTMSKGNGTVETPPPSPDAQAATFAELKALDGADSDFIVEMQEHGATLSFATAELLRRKTARIKELEANQSAKASTTTGVDPVGPDARKPPLVKGGQADVNVDDDVTDPVAEWNGKVDAAIAAAGCNAKRDKIVAQLQAKHPQLHARMLRAVNDAAGLAAPDADYYMNQAKAS